MTELEAEVYFSVVIPTRNRVALFREALDSVVQQDFDSREIIVVNDGSTGDSLDEYRALESEYPGVQFHYLIHRPNGHGQSYSMNFGALQAGGRYLCFLDDDDYWTDPSHLSRAYASLSGHESKADVYYTNQNAYLSDGQQVKMNPWIGDLSAVIPAISADAQGTCPVNAEFLLTSRGFAHLNCSIYRREFYFDIGGMDENIRYECDRDIYIRSIDRAACLLFNPAVISYHRVPDAKKGANMSTAVSEFQKRLYQLAVYEKGVLLSTTAGIKTFCMRSKGYQLKHISSALAEDGKYRIAFHYARQGLAVLPTFKWFGRTVYLCFRSLMSRA